MKAQRTTESFHAFVLSEVTGVRRNALGICCCFLALLSLWKREREIHDLYPFVFFTII